MTQLTPAQAAMPPNPRGGRFFLLETEPNIRIMYVCIYHHNSPTFTPTNRPDSPVVDQIAPHDRMALIFRNRQNRSPVDQLPSKSASIRVHQRFPYPPFNPRYWQNRPPVDQLHRPPVSPSRRITPACKPFPQKNEQKTKYPPQPRRNPLFLNET
jgi:hypothetical protein